MNIQGLINGINIDQTTDLNTITSIESFVHELDSEVDAGNVVELKDIVTLSYPVKIEDEEKTKNELSEALQAAADNQLTAWLAKYPIDVLAANVYKVFSHKLDKANIELAIHDYMFAKPQGDIVILMPNYESAKNALVVKEAISADYHNEIWVVINESIDRGFIFERKPDDSGSFSYMRLPLSIYPVTSPDIKLLPSHSRVDGETVYEDILITRNIWTRYNGNRIYEL